jgi:hypothetical protein
VPYHSLNTVSPRDRGGVLGLGGSSPVITTGHLLTIFGGGVEGVFGVAQAVKIRQLASVANGHTVFLFNIDKLLNRYFDDLGRGDCAAHYVLTGPRGFTVGDFTLLVV